MQDIISGQTSKWRELSDRVTIPCLAFRTITGYICADAKIKRHPTEHYLSYYGDTMNTMKNTARIAGLWYLLMAMTGPLGLMYIPSGIIVAGDTAATVNNIVANEVLYRLSVVSNLICQTAFIFVVLALYRLFKDVDKKYARLMVALVLVSVPIDFISVLNQTAPLILLNDDGYAKVFGQNQLNAYILLFLELFNHTNSLAEIFWGLWLLPFGVLTYKSGFIPKIFGVLLIIACFGYLASSAATFLFPEAKDMVGIFTSVSGFAGEISILLWFLIKGVKDQPMNANAASSHQ